MLSKSKYEDLQDYLLTETQFKVSVDVREFLHVFHVTQEVVLADKTPTLSVVIPTYKKPLFLLGKLTKDLPNLKHAINASAAKLKKYLGKLLCMHLQNVCEIHNKSTNGSNGFAGINPTIKFTWAEEHWERWCIEEARQMVQNAVSLLYVLHLLLFPQK